MLSYAAHSIAIAIEHVFEYDGGPDTSPSGSSTSHPREEPDLMTTIHQPRPVPQNRGVTRLVPAAAAARYAEKSSNTSSIARRSAGHPPLSQAVNVTVDSEGRPATVQWDHYSYVVVAQPVRWFARRRWWLEESRAERGREGLVAQEVWRVQLEDNRPGVLRAHSSETETFCTVDLGRSMPSGRWRLLRIHESPAEPERME